MSKAIKNLFIIFIFLCLCYFSLEARAQDVKQEMDAIVVKALEKNKIPGAIVGLWDAKYGNWIKAYGKADLENGQEMSWKFKVRIGGLSQTFTVALFLQLVEDKKLGLDERVARYLPFVPNGERITLRQLANNTSGIFDYTEDPDFWKAVHSEPFKEWQPHELLQIAFKHEPYFAPGEGWHASDTAFILLGMVMEKVTQYKIGTEIKKRFISPFKLKNTFFATAPFIEANYAQGYGEHNETLTLVNPSVSWAAGAMVSNLTDLSLWVKILAKADRFTDKTKNELFKFVDTDTPLIQNGLGIMKAGQFLGYSGHAPGYSSIMFYLPERDTTLIVLLNKFPDNGAAMEIFKQISKMLYPREAKF